MYYNLSLTFFLRFGIKWKKTINNFYSDFYLSKIGVNNIKILNILLEKNTYSELFLKY